MADYVTVAELKKRFDWRDIADLVSDEDQRVEEKELDTDVNLAACIGDASGDIDAALLIGGKYETTDLEGLTGNALSKLRRMCSEITMFYVLDRRPTFNSEKLEAYELMRNRHLKKLQTGENVFNLTAHVAAGVVSVEGPSTQNYNDLNLVRDRVRNYYPPRHLPGNR